MHLEFLGKYFGFEDAQKHHENLKTPPANEDQEGAPVKHEANLSHEIIAAAAGFVAMKMYEDHLRKTGEEPDHALMKELLAAFAAAEIDRLVETKGLDYLDREAAKQHAAEQAHHLAKERYGDGENGVQWMRDNGGYEPDFIPGYSGGGPGLM